MTLIILRGNESAVTKSLLAHHVTMCDGSRLTQAARQSVLAQKELLPETLPQIRKLLVLASTAPLLACVDLMARKLRIRGLVPLNRPWLVDVWVIACFCAYYDGRRSRCQ